MDEDEQKEHTRPSAGESASMYEYVSVLSIFLAMVHLELASTVHAHTDTSPTILCGCERSFE